MKDMVIECEDMILEPELRPEFINRVERVGKEKSVPVKDFAKRYRLK